MLCKATANPEQYLAFPFIKIPYKRIHSTLFAELFQSIYSRNFYWIKAILPPFFDIFLSIIASIHCHLFLSRYVNLYREVKYYYVLLDFSSRCRYSMVQPRQRLWLWLPSRMRMRTQMRARTWMRMWRISFRGVLWKWLPPCAEKLLPALLLRTFNVWSEERFRSSENALRYSSLPQLIHIIDKTQRVFHVFFKKLLTGTTEFGIIPTQ